MLTVLLIDADPITDRILSHNLRQAGHDLRRTADAESALVMIEEAMPHMVLLEWDLPGQSGLSLIRRLRARPHTADLPLIMVARRGAELDKVLALEAGADDYLVKPVGPRETLARIGAVLRRRQPVPAAGLRLDPGTGRVTVGNRQIALGRTEFRLLDFLMRHPQRVHSRAQLLDGVWGIDTYLNERTVDSHVGRLRHALEPWGHHARIETVRGCGYRFVPA